MIPVSFVVIIGRDGAVEPGLVDPKTMFVTFAGKLFGGSAGSFLNWAIAIMLIVALALSALNAIMGCARGLHQMADRRAVPAHLRAGEQARRAVVRDGVQRGRARSSSCSWAAPSEIYMFSNVGYLGSFLPVLFGYYLLRKNRPEIPRPVRLPQYFKYIALAMFAFYL